MRYMRQRDLRMREQVRKRDLIKRSDNDPNIGYQGRVYNYSKLIDKRRSFRNLFGTKTKCKCSNIINKQSQSPRAHTKNSSKHKPRATINSYTNQESQTPLSQGQSHKHLLKSKSHNPIEPQKYAKQQRKRRVSQRLLMKSLGWRVDQMDSWVPLIKI